MPWSHNKISIFVTREGFDVANSIIRIILLFGSFLAQKLIMYWLPFDTFSVNNTRIELSHWLQETLVEYYSLKGDRVINYLEIGSVTQSDVLFFGRLFLNKISIAAQRSSMLFHL